MTDPRAREQQRFDHLVLGRPRPAPVIGSKPVGYSKAQWKAEKERRREVGAVLLPGIEAHFRLREEHGGAKGTPETIAHLAARQARPGAIARLYASGAIDVDRLAAADKIATTYRAVTADTPLRTASWETRTSSNSGGPGDADLPPLTSVLGEWALEWWLQKIAQPDAMLAIVARDVGLTIAADRYALSVPRTRDLVRAALTTWWNRFGRSDVVGS